MPNYKYHTFYRLAPHHRYFRVGDVVEIYEERRGINHIIEVIEFNDTHLDSELCADNDYGAPTVVIAGYRAATAAEIKIFEQACAAERKKDQENKNKELERARKLLQQAGEL